MYFHGNRKYPLLLNKNSGFITIKIRLYFCVAFLLLFTFSTPSYEANLIGAFSRYKVTPPPPPPLLSNTGEIAATSYNSFAIASVIIYIEPPRHITLTGLFKLPGSRTRDNAAQAPSRQQGEKSLQHLFLNSKTINFAFQQMICIKPAFMRLRIWP